MPLEIHHCKEHDIPEFVQIETAAFNSGGGIAKLLMPEPLPDNWVQTSIDKHLKTMREEKDVIYLKVIDTDVLNGKMIAAAKWRVNKEERTEEVVRKTLPAPGPDDEGKPAMQDFLNFLARARWDYMGLKPFFFLQVLVTDPAHHRRGAGRMLIKWGTEQADNLQLPCFLEATEMGKPLYEREGFEVKHRQLWDLSKYGLQGNDATTIMIRKPLSHVK